MHYLIIVLLALLGQFHLLSWSESHQMIDQGPVHELYYLS